MAYKASPRREPIGIEHLDVLGRIGLAAAADTAAGTGHDLDHVEPLARLDLVQQILALVSPLATPTWMLCSPMAT